LIDKPRKKKMKKDDVVATPPTSPASTDTAHSDHDNNSLVMGEFDPSEVERTPLDNLNKKDRDYTYVRHLFVTDDQYDLFCMLPGGNQVKDLIVSDFLGGEDRR
jgi:hypothetical protein